MKTMVLTVMTCVALFTGANAQCVVWPGSLSVPADYACQGIWTDLLAPLVPPSLESPRKDAYIPPEGHYISFVVTETDKLDIPADQQDVTLVVVPPAGWAFRSDPLHDAYVFISNDGDINLPMSSALRVTADSIVLTYSSNVNCNKLDWIYFLNIEACPTSGVINPPGPVRYAYSTTQSLGSMGGIVPMSTVFATLTLTPGTFNAGGVVFTVSPTSRTLCDDVLGEIMTIDCAGNPTTVDVPAQLNVVVDVFQHPARTDFPKTLDLGTAAGNGVGEITGYIRDPGAYFLTAEPPSPWATVSCTPFSLTVCPPSKLVWIVQPNQHQQEAWRPLVPSPLVLELQDAYDNPSYLPGNVTLQLESMDDPAAVLRGTPTAAIGTNARVSIPGLGVTTWVAAALFQFDPQIDVSGVATSRSQFFDFADPMPIELVAFSGAIVDGRVQLKWRTMSETNNYGFDVERSSTDGPWEIVGFVRGAGTSNTPREYRFEDAPPPYGAVYYRLHQIDRDGRSSYSPVVMLQSGPAPNSLRVYPTVVTGAGTLHLTLASRSTVTVEVYNSLGQKLQDLARDITLEGGSHALPFSCGVLPPGAYFLRCTAGPTVLTTRFLRD